MPISRSNYYKRRKSVRKNSNQLGGECDVPVQDDEVDPSSLELLSLLTPNQRFTFQNKCYDIRSICKWISIGKNTFPHNGVEISDNDNAFLANKCSALTFYRCDLEILIHNLMNTTDIDLTNQYITNIDANVFNNLPHVTSILLNNEDGIHNLQNRISILPQGLFNGVPNLDVLNLSHNIIQDLSSAHHIQLQYLTQLDLSNNIINALPITINLRNLEILLLNNNNITILPANVFSNLPKLLEINLTYNEITELPTNVFSKLNKLTELYLSNNQINDLQPGVFNGLNSLKTLYLNFNRIVILRQNVFNLVTLTDLRLTFNPATNPINLEHGALDILSNLRTIYPDGLIPYLPSTSQQRCRLDSQNDHLLSAQAIASAHANPDLANDPKLHQLLSLVQAVPPVAPPAAPIFDDDDDDDNAWVNDESDDSPPSNGGNLQRNSQKINRNNYRKSQRKNYSHLNHENYQITEGNLRSISKKNNIRRKLSKRSRLIMKGGMQIVIKKMDKTTFTIDVNGTDTFSVIKKKIEALTGIPVDRQLLAFPGQHYAANDEYTVSAYNMQEGNTILLVILSVHEKSTTKLIK